MMEIFDMPPRSKLAAGTTEIKVEIISDPYLVASRFGYLPMVTVRYLEGGLENSMLLAAQSLMEALEKLRSRNGGQLRGLQFAIRKESTDQKAKYLIRAI
jgi:hypothetical protein